MFILAENIKEEEKVAEDLESEAKEESKKEKKNKYKEQLDKLEAEYATLKNDYLKVYAEMENTKRRIKDEAIKDRKYASQKVVGELIGPVDMLLQIVNMPAPTPEIQNYQIGFQMIANQLLDILKNEGLAPIEALGKDFDPSLMQAVQTEETEDSENIVLKVMQPGYMYKDRVLRPAMVTVSKKKSEEKKEEE
ncbi:MAG: nucleotide exchange factor GrpE [Erysipelotrichaceae bacterium]|nr:nucleotide exchange factor GrpE [Erysipelotrichaceae bacterium]